MQSSWPASDIFQEMAAQYVERVQAMSGGRLKIDLLPAGAVVGAFQVQDACHDGVIDAAHTVPVYWYGKNKAASLFGTGPVFGGDANQMIAWLYHGGGQEFYRELTQDILGLNVVGFLSFGMPAQPLGWFKSEITDAAQLKGLKYRTVGLAADLFQAMGASRRAASGRRDRAGHGARRHRRLRVQQPDLRHALRLAGRGQELHARPPTTRRRESFEYIFNRDTFEGLDPDLQAILKYGVESAHLSNYALAMDQYSADLQKLADRDRASTSSARRDSVLAGAARSLGQDPAAAAGGPVLQEGGGQPEGLVRARRLLQPAQRAGLQARLPALLSRARSSLTSRLGGRSVDGSVPSRRCMPGRVHPMQSYIRFAD